MIADFFDLPWPSIAAFLVACATATGLASTLLPKMQRLRKWIGGNIQELTGVAGLRTDISEHISLIEDWQETERSRRVAWEEKHSNEASARDHAIEQLSKLVQRLEETKDHRA